MLPSSLRRLLIILLGLLAVSLPIGAVALLLLLLLLVCLRLVIRLRLGSVLSSLRRRIRGRRVGVVVRLLVGRLGLLDRARRRVGGFALHVEALLTQGCGRVSNGQERRGLETR